MSRVVSGYQTGFLRIALEHFFTIHKPSARLQEGNTYCFEGDMAIGPLIDPNLINGVPKGIRTPVAAVKGQCPRPLDDGDGMLFS